jgi:predicted choloylglycine hydrolase
MRLSFHAIAEDHPGPRWKAHAMTAWPSYHRWWLRDGDRARPTFLQCRKAIRTHMPELEPVWQQLTDAMGGGDAPARFLSMWCPPPYITGCSQAVWLGRDPSEARLLRNYDFAPALLEGMWFATRWTGRRVAAITDCLWGVLDGVNEAGLVVSLSFGGRTATGEGFGIPLVLRYVLEVAETVPQAVGILRRLPHHMTYTISLLDAAAAWSTVFVAPDRPLESVDRRSATNIQHAVEWPEHERATRAALRDERLAAALHIATNPEELLARMLEPPLRQDAFARGYGTLYTAVYAPVDATIRLAWPGEPEWRQSIAAFRDEDRDIEFTPNAANGEIADLDRLYGRDAPPRIANAD